MGMAKAFSSTFSSIKKWQFVTALFSFAASCQDKKNKTRTAHSYYRYIVEI